MSTASSGPSLPSFGFAEAAPSSPPGDATILVGESPSATDLQSLLTDELSDILGRMSSLAAEEMRVYVAAIIRQAGAAAKLSGDDRELGLQMCRENAKLLLEVGRLQVASSSRKAAETVFDVGIGLLARAVLAL